jgi:signal transduction histidine kinase
MNEVRKIYEVRNKISQDLHDEIGSTLSGVLLFSELAQKKIEQQHTSEADTYLHRITQQSKEMAEKMSDIVWAINPQNDNLKKVISKLQAFAVNVCAAKNMRVQFEVDQDLLLRQMSMQQRKNIYMISKEAINNAVKYSAAQNVVFSLHHKGAHFLLTIKDDGTGFDMKTVRKGNGMNNMVTRAEEMKSDLLIESKPGVGTAVALKW